jgi:hypothetical protein
MGKNCGLGGPATVFAVTTLQNLLLFVFVFRFLFGLGSSRGNGRCGHSRHEKGRGLDAEPSYGGQQRGTEKSSHENPPPFLVTYSIWTFGPAYRSPVMLPDALTTIKNGRRGSFRAAHAHSPGRERVKIDARRYPADSYRVPPN